MPGCCSSSRSRWGPDLRLMRSLVSLFSYFAPREFFEKASLPHRSKSHFNGLEGCISAFARPIDRSSVSRITEKWEGLALIPVRNSRSKDDYVLLVGKDNDFKASTVSHNGVAIATNCTDSRHLHSGRSDPFARRCRLGCVPHGRDVSQQSNQEAARVPHLARH